MRRRIKLVQRYKCPNNDLFVVALLLFVGFLLFELAARIYNLYHSVPYVDVPSHFLAGMALAAGSYWIVSLTLIQSKRLAAVWFTFIGAVIWEALETLEEIIVPNPSYLKDIFFWDGFSDIIVTVIGGVAVMFVLQYLRARFPRKDGVKARPFFRVECLLLKDFVLQ